jgi:hypothetical protein
VAPDTGEGTPLEKDSNADTGAIVDGVAFDVKNQWLVHFFILGPSSLSFSLWEKVPEGRMRGVAMSVTHPLPQGEDV